MILESPAPQRKFRVVIEHHQKFRQRLERLRHRAAPWQLKHLAAEHGLSVTRARLVADLLGLSVEEMG